MGADYAFSIIYSSLWGVLIIPMILIIVKSITKDRNSRDWYSIMTFLFIFLVLSLRALSIIPELIHGEMISSYGNEWEQAVFIGAPMLIFWLAIFVHSFKWLDLEYKLTTVRSFPSLYKTTMSIIIIVNLVVIGIGFSVFWIDIDILNIKTIFAYFIITFYATTYLKLVTINVYLIFKFWRIVKRMHPKLYEEIKVKLNIYFIFIIVLLTARLLFIIPLVIEYYGNYHLIKSSVHTIEVILRKYYFIIIRLLCSP